MSEKIKPFRLVKYFTFASIVVMFFGTLIFSLLHSHWIKSLLQQKNEDYAIVMIENLNHQIFLQFIIPTVLKHGNIQLRKKEQFERLDKIIKRTLHSFKVEMVNIYGMNNVISYSFNKKMLGKKNLGGTGYLNALSGKTTSNITQRGNFAQIFFGFPKERKIITYAPLRTEKPLAKISGPVIGIIEVVQNLSQDNSAVFKLQLIVIQTCSIVMGILFFILRLIVKRGENIIEKRAEERLKLKEQLDKTKHLASLGIMTAGVSHEIKNPLGIIKSSAELLKKKISAITPAVKISDIIIEESNRLNNIITDFLNFAKPKKPEFILINIIEIIEKNLSFLNEQIEENNYNIKKYYNYNIPEIDADPDMLYQAFLNILINSMQAMPDGGELFIAISFTNKNVIFFLGDKGNGIDKDSLGKIWDPFFTTKTNGTGLGLCSVKNIIETHNGTITIKNRIVKGVQIAIELPINQNQ